MFACHFDLINSGLVALFVAVRKMIIRNYMTECNPDEWYAVLKGRAAAMFYS